MFLFILESIGTQELIFIALVALIVLGPRKLPQMMRTVGKTMAEFRNATNEFKTTWEREADFHENSSGEKINSIKESPIAAENGKAETLPLTPTENHLPAPEVKELSAEDFSKNFPDKKNDRTQPKELKVKKTTADKTDWL